MATIPTPVCSSDRPDLADELSADINEALDGAASVSISLRDSTTNTTCAVDGDQKYDSASTVKVTVLAALLWDAQSGNRTLTQEERERATAMITESDNDATTALWKRLGDAKISAFLHAAGMTDTVPDKENYWGLTQVTANDQEKLMQLVTSENPTLRSDSRAFILELMGDVVDSQRWGTPAGVPLGTKTYLKNGWLERASNGWRVHSLGAFTAAGHDYTLTVLSQDNATMEDGIARIESVARVVHNDLNAYAAGPRS
ncbi:serine hydrolase [Streptomyces parvulus]|uniref:serine hydrolase n=1 Tax=Streptomyces parvulus TaxID=146923 RepID=UPI0037DA2FBF